jgi:hypothetical protein
MLHALSPHLSIPLSVVTLLNPLSHTRVAYSSSWWSRVQLTIEPRVGSSESELDYMGPRQRAKQLMRIAESEPAVTASDSGGVRRLPPVLRRRESVKAEEAGEEGEEVPHDSKCMVRGDAGHLARSAFPSRHTPLFALRLAV